jgi:hypothetical protein
MRGEIWPITATDAVLLSPSRCTWETRSGDVKESGSLGWQHAQQTANAPDGSQRGPSSRRAGTPATGRRATACEVGASSPSGRLRR